MITSASYSVLQSSKATCAASCSQSSAALAMSSQYYWNASAWGACPVQCDGGLQTRTVSCVNSLNGMCARPAILHCSLLLLVAQR